MPDSDSPPPRPRRADWSHTSWAGATFVALLAPVLLFWTWVLLNIPLPKRPGLLLATGLWLAVSIALAYAPSRAGRTWGLGLLAGVAACLPWAVVPGLIA